MCFLKTPGSAARRSKNKLCLEVLILTTSLIEIVPDHFLELGEEKIKPYPNELVWRTDNEEFTLTLTDFDWATRAMILHFRSS